MSVYIRYSCPNCSQSLNLRLEYLNRRVVCNACQQPFLSRAKIRVPASASSDLVAAIQATNRAQGYFESEAESQTVESLTPALGDDRELGEALGQARSRVAELERALAEAEARHVQQLEQSETGRVGDRQELEAQAERLAAQQGRLVATLEGERDAARHRVNELGREQAELVRRLTEVEEVRDRLLEERTATAVVFDRQAARVGELERTLGEIQARHAEELSTRREEERRALALASERLARERENASEQLRDVLTQLEDALAQLELTRRQGVADREAMRAEIEAARSGGGSLDPSLQLPSRQELDHFQGEVERLAGEVNRAEEEKAAESRRCEDLSAQLNQRETELEELRRLHEVEAETHQLVVEELQLRLRYRRPSDMPAALDGFATPDSDPVDALPGPDSDKSTDIELTETETETEIETETETAEPLPALVTLPVPVTAEVNSKAGVVVGSGPNPPDSPDERIAALRSYLRNAQEADNERLNKRLLRRLVRVWRHEAP